MLNTWSLCDLIIHSRFWQPVDPRMSSAVIISNRDSICSITGRREMRRFDLSRCISATLTRFFTISCDSSLVTVTSESLVQFRKSELLCYGDGTVGLAIAFVAAAGRNAHVSDRSKDTRVSFRVRRIVTRLHGSRELFLSDVGIARIWSKCDALFRCLHRERKIENREKSWKHISFLWDHYNGSAAL